jgi:hypothetical protein
MSDPRVVNLRDLHVSSATSARSKIMLPVGVAKVDRSTPYGNPYPITAELSRADSLFAYRRWLWRRLRAEPDYLEPLRGKRLACWCVPLACHAEVILALLDLGPSPDRLALARILGAR